MTEYDYSPEAIEAHLRKQARIAKWVDRTNTAPPCNPFTPTTPAVHALKMKSNDYDDDSDYSSGRGHHRKDRRDRDHRDYDQEKDKRRPHTKRHRSASHSDPQRPTANRSYTVPPQLNIPPHHRQASMSSTTKVPSPTSAYPPTSYPQYYPQIISPRDSRHSSRSSSTTRPQASPTYIVQQPPYSAPPYKPSRSHTIPHNYAFPEKHYGYPSQVALPIQNGMVGGGYPVVSPRRPIDPASAPQYPYSMYQTKETPIIKRIWQKFLGGGKQQQHSRNDSYSSLHAPNYHRPAQRKRSTSF